MRIATLKIEYKCSKWNNEIQKVKKLIYKCKKNL